MATTELGYPTITITIKGVTWPHKDEPGARGSFVLSGLVTGPSSLRQDGHGRITHVDLELTTDDLERLGRWACLSQPARPGTDRMIAQVKAALAKGWGASPISLEAMEEFLDDWPTATDR